MQELTPDARARLTRFDGFVKAEISVQVESARAGNHQGARRLARHRRSADHNAEVLSLLTDDPDGIGMGVERSLAEAETIAGGLRTCDLDGLGPVEHAPLKALETWRAARTTEAVGHAALQDASERQRVQAALTKLEARDELKSRIGEVLAHVAALREIERLAAAKSKVGTTTLSSLITRLSRRLEFEADLQGSLNRHLQALNFQGLEVAVKSKTVKGKPMFSLRFKTVADVPLSSVLSQGEQRRLALAMFLAEMDVLGESNPIVLDDPVSSIDQEGRRHIARTLCELARDRQVIVFTHELSFVHELRRQAHGGVPAHFQHVCRRGRRVGLCARACLGRASHPSSTARPCSTGSENCTPTTTRATSTLTGATSRTSAGCCAPLSSEPWKKTSSGDRDPPQRHDPHEEPAQDCFGS